MPKPRFDRETLAIACLDALLKRPGGVRQRGSEYTIRCPLPERHSHEDRNPSASFNATLGVWCCHACGASGGLLRGDYPLAPLIGVADSKG